MTYYLYKDDIPSEIQFGDIVAIDTETMGLNLNRDRLCLIQLSNGDGDAHLVQISPQALSDENSFVNLKKIFKNPNSTKLFHFARFDIAVIEKNICLLDGLMYCTKIASKLSRTFGARHGLADLCRDLLDIELDKYNQTSDWGTADLCESQLAYAASDVLYLHRLKKELDIILKREKRQEIALECFNFLKTRCQLDIIGFDNLDIFSH
ncbi:ribonuclease H-like domain-containing protein [Alphaproteobacteria bacterium]|nr:ribonuclease H-like domain-containing protein [Alphaproteobacteria bacterium]